MSDFSHPPRLALSTALAVTSGKTDLVSAGAGARHFSDPAESAQAWARSGARWGHVIDRDATVGRGINRVAIRRIPKLVRAASVQLAVGIMGEDSLEDALGSGATRIVLSTVGLEGAISGKALRVQAFSLAEALDVAGD